MTDPYRRWLADRVADATPTTLQPFDAIRRRARRDRLRSTSAVVASAALVASVVVGGWSLQGSNPGPEPSGPVTSPSSEDSTPGRPEPTYDKSEQYPSGLVVRLPDRDVALPAHTSCWTEPQNCLRGLLHFEDTGPDLGEHDTIKFWFARPGWKFQATFMQAGETCPRNTTVEATSNGGQWFELPPADEAGTYEVDLMGEGPEGNVAARFVWTTTTAGPVDPPVGTIGLFPGSRGEGSYGLELWVDDLPFHPTKEELPSMVDVNVTAADGTRQTLTVSLERSMLECGFRGTRGFFYYQAEWNEDIATLGEGPLLLESELTIRDTTYVGRATWRDARRAMPEMEFEPPLPTADTD